MFFPFLGWFGGCGPSGNEWERGKCLVLIACWQFWWLPTLAVEGISTNTPRIISPGESPQDGTQPGPLLDIFLTLCASPYFFHIPFIAIQNSRESTVRERWSVGHKLSCRYAAPKNVGSNCPNCMMPQKTAVCISCQKKKTQANTAKLGIVFGRAKPGIGTFRLFQDVLGRFKL